MGVTQNIGQKNILNFIRKNVTELNFISVDIVLNSLSITQIVMRMNKGLTLQSNNLFKIFLNKFTNG